MIAARSHRGRGPAHHRPAEKRTDVVPYDYGATFRITGRPGNVIQSVINTAPDSLFVAVAIGYGLEEDRGRALVLEPPIDEDTVQIVVRDRGLGIAPERRERIFDRFFQAHLETHRSGMGLGLYISREIVRQHGGDLTVEFPVDGGSWSLIALPARRREVSDRPDHG